MERWCRPEGRSFRPWKEWVLGVGEVVKEKRSRERKVEGGRERRRRVVEWGAGVVEGDGWGVVVIGFMEADIRKVRCMEGLVASYP